MTTCNSLTASALALLLSIAAHAQFGTPLATNLQKSWNISYVTVATNQPGKFIPGIPITSDSETWTGIRVHFRRDDRATRTIASK